MPMLVVSYNDGSLSYPLKEGVPVFIGRARGCDIQLPSPMVSRRHAVIIYKDGLCGVKDLDSFNGTLLNDELITQPSHLTDSDVLSISSFTIRFHSLDAATAPSSKPSSDIRHDESGADSTVSSSPDQPEARAAGGDDASGTTTIAPRDDEASPNGNAAPAAPHSGMPPESGPSLPTGSGVAASPSADVEATADATIELTTPAAYAATLAATARADLEAILPAAPQPHGTSISGREPTPMDTDYFRPENPGHVIPHTPLGTDTDTGGLFVDAPEDSPALTPDKDDEAADLALDRLAADLPPCNEASGNPGVPVTTETADPNSTGAWTNIPEETDAAENHIGPNASDAMARANTSAKTSLNIGGAMDPGDVAPAPVSPALMTAINARLSLYSLLAELAEQRKFYRMANPDMQPDVAAELNRQDGEISNLPSAEEADKRIKAAQKAHTAFAATAGSARAGAPQPSSLPREVEEMANSQWLLIRDSNREALPSVFKEAYQLVADEDLAKELAAAGINHGRLLGGAAYLLVLEAMAESAQTDRNAISTRLQREPGSGAPEKQDGLLGRLGRAVSRFVRGESDPGKAQRRKELECGVRLQAAQLLNEFEFMEKILFPEFQTVYAHTAAHFVPRRESMPLAVRAFLRYGAIGFKPWWMSDRVRDFIVRDCTDHVVPSFEVGPNLTGIVYADEYLAAVAHQECSPFPDESLRELERSGVEWKTERAYRRIVSSKPYNILMEDMLQSLDLRLKAVADELDYLEKEMAPSEIGSPAARKGEDAGLQMRHQMAAIRRTSLERHIRRIEKEVVAPILESVEEAEGRFRGGELRMPEPEALVGREARALADLARRMSGSKPRFMPLALRRHFPLDPDDGVINDRDTVETRLQHIERMDPGVFASVVIPGKRKDQRVELRLSPVIVILPAAGLKGVCSTGREGMDGGHLALPICFTKEHTRNRQIANLIADFRWKTSRNMAGRDVMKSDTLAGAFMKIRWEWRNEPKEKRERGLIFTETTDAKNWRRVYELYLSDAMTGARQLFLRNPECYFAIINKFIDLPEGVKMLKRIP